MPLWLPLRFKSVYLFSEVSPDILANLLRLSSSKIWPGNLLCCITKQRNLLCCITAGCWSTSSYWFLYSLTYHPCDAIAFFMCYTMQQIMTPKILLCATILLVEVASNSGASFYDYELHRSLASITSLVQSNWWTEFFALSSGVSEILFSPLHFWLLLSHTCK